MLQYANPTGIYGLQERDEAHQKNVYKILIERK